ncbi:MAG: MotA/TolQ/ExbB proton channel family protein [Gammaproteobacteria bacterium]|nr:MotA/TolQ/ExbB proton channel family protein [Gammaproteobacteria bacterium]MBV9697679.1 MotA/TolQ/ExbB proton channel family protein [Gammaproteobacteria bacterium]
MENQAPVAPTNAGSLATDNPYGLAALWQSGNIVTRSVLVLLLIMSLASWYVILTKLWDQSKLKKSARVVEKQFWSAPSLKDGVDRLKKGDEFRSIAEDGLRAASHHDGRLTDRIDLNEWITMSLQRAVDGVISKMQNGLGLLATVGSTAPFVGLFGTVWGILQALVGIGIAGQASIDKVAGPVGEALIMTAIGLFVAVPAVMGYNWLLGRNKVLTDALRNFAADLHAYLVSGARVTDTGGARPAAAKAAPVSK